MKRVAVCIVSLAVTASAVTAWPHTDEILGCNRNLPVDRVEKVGEWMLPNGLLAEAYDRNGDGQHDIVALSSITAIRPKPDGGVEVEHKPHPVFYLVDIDLDGEPDKVYVDRTGEGKCDQIVLYLDLRESPSPGELERKRST